MHFYPVSCLWQNVQCPGESLSNKEEVHLEILVMSPVLNVRESFFICYVEFFGLNMRPTWILVLVQSLHLINLQLFRKLTKHLFVPEENCWCRLSWIIPSKTSITTIPLSTTIYKLPFGVPPPLLLYNEKMFSYQQSGPLLEYQKTGHKNFLKCKMSKFWKRMATSVI